MQKHTQIYLDFMKYTYDNYGVTQHVPCEICGLEAVDIHHIYNRGMGGSKKVDVNQIQNLMALCRKDHVDYGDYPEYVDKLKEIHRLFVANRLKEIKSMGEKWNTVIYSELK